MGSIWGGCGNHWTSLVWACGNTQKRRPASSCVLYQNGLLAPLRLAERVKVPSHDRQLVVPGRAGGNPERFDGLRSPTKSKTLEQNDNSTGLSDSSPSWLTKLRSKRSPWRIGPCCPLFVFR